MNVVLMDDLYLVRYKEKRDNARFLLAREYRIVVNGKLIVIPAEFSSDLSSVPFLFRWLASKTDSIEGSIVHDYLYRHPQPGISRAMADEIFHEINKGQVSAFKNALLYSGVRAGGWYTWRQTR